MVMRLASRQEGVMIYKLIEYREKLTEFVMRNETEDYREYTKSEFYQQYNFHIGRFQGLLEAVAQDLKTSEDNVLKLISNLDR